MAIRRVLVGVAIVVVVGLTAASVLYGASQDTQNGSDCSSLAAPQARGCGAARPAHQHQGLGTHAQRTRGGSVPQPVFLPPPTLPPTAPSQVSTPGQPGSRGLPGTPGKTGPQGPPGVPGTSFITKRSLTFPLHVSSPPNETVDIAVTPCPTGEVAFAGGYSLTAPASGGPKASSSALAKGATGWAVSFTLGSAPGSAKVFALCTTP